MAWHFAFASPFFPTGFSGGSGDWFKELRSRQIVLESQANCIGKPSEIMFDLKH
jgi:hypothetical protein